MSIRGSSSSGGKLSALGSRTPTWEAVATSVSGRFDGCIYSLKLGLVCNAAVGVIEFTFLGAEKLIGRHR